MTNPPWQPYDIAPEACTDEHDWRATGEQFQSEPPIIAYQCAKCGGYAESRDGYYVLREVDMKDARTSGGTS